ncbi:MAG: N-formylglutamate amidohydrolase [Candidatus Devosia phytovorans]|uniref:N-formylglutamate amidohydrolase n=1 Tax=Candidatus Devosia phytovorans TaxID=3121372 RepID=A0AAJ6B393_9HYPH|nr:N-formylglutamate amidohydrolase [Devosia sp.]WEK06158.1 MAG: N-formylglutamate amidohydrolase [Devosia sp.]
MSYPARPVRDDLHLQVEEADLWSMHRAASPLIGTAIHNGHYVRADIKPLMALDESSRLREEDPFTEYTIRDVPNRIIFHRSRFEIDLNRARDGAVYLTPEQAWDLDVWARPPAEPQVNASLHIHDSYYSSLAHMLSEIEAEFGRFVLLDMHSYNHRRSGPHGEPTSPDDAPVINIGTSSMDRAHWAHVLDPFMESLRSFSFRGQTMDVRENVAFQGRGEQTRFVHENFPQSGCAIAVEFKKIFMDEWTGLPDREALEALRTMIRQSLPVLLTSLRTHA